MKVPTRPPSLSTLLGRSQAGLETVLEQILAEARAAWPGLGVTPEAFLRHLGQKVDGADAVRALGQLHTSDLYLACGCALGDRAALEAFDRQLLPAVSKFLEARHQGASTVDEIEQLLRERLLLGQGGKPPRIASYTGGGALGAWLRVAGVRVGRNLSRSTRNEVGLEPEMTEQLRSRSPDPELDYLKAHSQKELKAAFEATLQQLTKDERNVLRLYFLDGMTVTAIGTTYGVNASTITRWIAKARATIFERTREILGERLKLQPRELNSLMGLVESQFNLTVSRVLKHSRG